MGQLWASLWAKAPPPDQPVPTTSSDRLKNFIVENGRGALGSIPIIIIVIYLIANMSVLKTKPDTVVLCVYLIMFLTLLIHPLKVPAVSFIPIVMLPLFHVIASDKTCKGFLCGNTLLMISGGYLHQLLNVCGWDKRFANWMIFGKDVGTAKLTNVQLLIKASFASYFLSMFTSRQYVGPYLMDLVVGSMTRSAEKTESTNNLTPQILALAIASSASIGSMGIVISARNVMFMRSMWEVAGHPDTFNFFDFFCFALPVTLLMFGLNLGYNIILIRGKYEMNDTEAEAYRKAIKEQSKDIPESKTSHEILTLTFIGITFLLYFTRWSEVLKKMFKSKGWADFKKGKDKKGNTKVPDVTVAALMMVICCIMPHTFGWVKIWKAKTKADLPPAKPDTAIVHWKIVDKNTNYGYMFLVGSFCALDIAMRQSKFATTYLYKQLGFITKASRPVGVLLWCIFGCILSNIMTSAGAVGMLTVLALNAYEKDSKDYKYLFQFVLASGISTGFGLLAWFKYTPGFHVKNANVPPLTQIKYSAGSLIICLLVMWLGVAFYAPAIFEASA
ncbi:sodium-dependent high-affinity dicarboxylate transporter 3-like [Phthorimaea operculella]|nr:sodium-dependent high-affinity dicarboxylate transporter 3-like [Phthorimaea operculella]